MIDYSRYYRAYAEMKDTLEGDYAKMYLTAAMADADNGEDSLNGNMSNRIIDMDWVLTFEDCVPYIEKAIDQQRKFIEEYNQVDRIDKIKQVRKDAITHLTQHTNLIQSIDPDGSVVPGKLLNTLREDSFATYENRFLYTLIFKAISFIEARFRALQNAPNDSDAEVRVSREVQLNKQKLSLNLAYDFESHERDKVNKEEDLESLTDYERILRLRMKLDDFVNTELIQKLKGCIKVKSPINKTNCIKQDPAFKKCYELWTFIESYLKPGYVLEIDTFDGTMPQSMKDEMYELMAYEHFVMLMNTNPALKEKLNDEYLAEKKRREEEANKPEEEMQRYIEEKIYEVRREEMALRLAEVRDRESQILKLQTELEQERERVHELERKIEELTALVAQREKELEQARNELRMVQVHVTKLEAAIAALQNKVAFLTGYIQKLESDINEYVLTISEMNTELNVRSEKINVLTVENGELKDTIKQNNETIARQESKIADQEYRMGLTTAALDKLNSRYQQLQDDHKILEQQYSDSQDQCRAYEGEIVKYKSDKEDLEHTIRVKDNVISAKDSAINNVISRNDELQKRVDDFDAYHARMKKTSDDIWDKYESRESEVVRLRNTVASQSAAMISRQQKQQDELDSLQHQIDDVVKDKENTVVSMQSQIDQIEKDKEKSLKDMQSLIDKANKDKSEAIRSMQKQIDGSTKEKDAAVENVRNVYEAKIREMKAEYEAKIKSLEQQTVSACTFTDDQKYSIRLAAERKTMQEDYDNKLAEVTKKARKYVKKARVLADDYPEKLLSLPETKDYM